MKEKDILRVGSLISILLLALHFTDDIVRGISKAEPANLFAVLILAVLLYGTLMLAERRSGQVIMLLTGFISAAMPYLHMRGSRYAEIAASSGGFFFVWTLLALGAIGLFCTVLAARGLWSMRSGAPR